MDLVSAQASCLHKAHHMIKATPKLNSCSYDRLYHAVIRIRSWNLLFCTFCYRAQHYCLLHNRAEKNQCLPFTLWVHRNLNPNLGRLRLPQLNIPLIASATRATLSPSPQDILVVVLSTSEEVLTVAVEVKIFPLIIVN